MGVALPSTINPLCTRTCKTYTFGTIQAQSSSSSLPLASSFPSSAYETTFVALDDLLLPVLIFFAFVKLFDPRPLLLLLRSSSKSSSSSSSPLLLSTTTFFLTFFDTFRLRLAPEDEDEDEDVEAATLFLPFPYPFPFFNIFFWFFFILYWQRTLQTFWFIKFSKFEWHYTTRCIISPIFWSNN